MKQMTEEDVRLIKALDFEINGLHCNCSLRESGECHTCIVRNYLIEKRREITNKYIEFVDYAKSVTIKFNN